MSWFQNNFTEVFLLWPFTKIAKKVLLGWTKWLPELKIEKKTFKIHLLGQWPDSKMISTTFAKMVLIQEGQLSISGERMCTILVNRLEDWACPVNVWLGKLTALYMTPLGWLGRKTSTQTNGSALLNKMVTRAKNRKTFKRHLHGQWPDFKIISHQCSFYAPLPKLLKWFCSAEQILARAKNRRKKKL